MEMLVGFNSLELEYVAQVSACWRHGDGRNEGRRSYRLLGGLFGLHQIV